MPVKVTSTMQGKNYSDVIDKVAEKVVREYGITIQRQARALAAVKTGRLKGSITYQTEHFGGSPKSPATGADVIDKPTDEHTCYVGTNVSYAQHMEYGTDRNITGQPYLRPAVDIAKKSAGAAAALEIRKAMKAENAQRYIAI